MLDRDEIDALFPSDLPDVDHWERHFPKRDLADGVQVMRFCPSPTGAMHLGGIYVAMLDQAIARQSGGVYIIRIEDTDQEREVEGAAGDFDRILGWFGLTADEFDGQGDYGPYTQSQRADIYMSFARDLMRRGKAYPCFATKDELTAMAAEQRAMKVQPGYYGRWAPWRDAADDLVRARLEAGEPYVVRLRSPGEGERRVTFTDIIRGEITANDNQNDVVLLKSSASALRLPTYHFAHLIDDHLMRATIVLRGEEWISSVPVHLQLLEANGFERIPYAHVAPLMKQQGSARRKLSKRKDPEASAEFYIEAGYPRQAILSFLRGLANSRLSYLTVAESLTEPVHLEEAGMAGPLVDLAKLDHVASEWIALMDSEDVLNEVLIWAGRYDPELAAAVEPDRGLAVRALDIERKGVENPRKDLGKWSDFRTYYGYFFNPLFDLVSDQADERLGGIAPEAVRKLCAAYLDRYVQAPDGDAWFEHLRAVSETCGFAPTVRAYKDAPDQFVGSVREASQIIRVALTGTKRSPGLHLVTDVLGEPEVRRRIGALLG
ncbi:MAG: glutamate--tRNA ligase [Alphaproteobacteria bacterium]|nr:glutamate--tRNA ligase [Alphaproteobacteria bacterium]